MAGRLINIGFGNVAQADRIISIVTPDSAPSKRLIQDARDKGVLVDASHGRRTRSVIVMDSSHVLLSALQPETLAGRMASKGGEVD